MAIKTYTPKVKVSGYTTITRVCSNCSKTWTEKVKIEIEEKGDSSWFGPDQKEANKIKAKANQRLKDREASEQKQADKYVLCPHCEHFSTGAVEKHFPQGYFSAFKKKYKKALVYALIFMPFFGLIAYFIGKQVLYSSSKDWSDYWFLIILFAAVGLLFAWGFLVNLRNAFRVLTGYSRVNKYLPTVKEDELHNIAVSVYKKNKNSLSGYIGWAEMLLERSKSA